MICGLENSIENTNNIEGGIDGTIISDIFDLLSVGTSNLKKDKVEGRNQKCKLTNPQVIILNSCIVLATVAHHLILAGKKSAAYILTSSSKKQHDRLSILAYISSSGNKTSNSTPLEPYCASAMLALSSFVSLEDGGCANFIIDTVLALVPSITTMQNHLRLESPEVNALITNCNALLSNWHGQCDGLIGLLEMRLKWGGPLAAKQACSSGVPQHLIHLFSYGFRKYSVQESEKLKNKVDVSLSPNAVMGIVSSINYCLPAGAVYDILFRKESVKIFCDLISDMHLKILNDWNGPGGGKKGIMDLINAVIDLLAFPFIALQSAPGLPATSASISSSHLLNIGSPGGHIGIENKDLIKTIEKHLPQYLQILLEVIFIFIIFHYYLFPLFIAF